MTDGCSAPANERRPRLGAMREPIVIAPGAGEIVGDAPDRRVEILCDHDALHATWSRFGAHRDGADLHVHRRHSDLFYVLAGELTVRLGPRGDGVAVPAGTLARVPPLVVHGFRNGSDAEVRYLNLHAPGQGFADYMRTLRDGRTLAYDQHSPPADGGRAATDAAIGTQAKQFDQPGLRLTLLADVEEIAIAEAWAQPGEPPSPHVHHDHLEAFYVLEGELVLTSGERELRAPAGSWGQVPPGVSHTVAALGSQPARFVNLHAPSCGFGAFLRALRDGADEATAATRAAFDQQPAP
jgi:mannose-6-phosphate isomerase-like protein (cupin superfamily)